MTDGAGIIVVLPEVTGGRLRVHECLSEVPNHLAHREVTVDASRMVLSSPSFLDELVKVLTERGVVAITFLGVSEDDDREMLLDCWLLHSGSIDQVRFEPLGC